MKKLILILFVWVLYTPTVQAAMIDPTPLPTCMPRPICLDATPPCLIAIPIGGFCPPTITPIPTPKACNTICISDSDCQSGYCYQPPFPTCPSGQACPMIMPARICRNPINPTDPICMQSPISPTPPTTVCNSQCQTDSDCSTGFCYQPPMPTCAPGLACSQVLPARVCRTATNPTDSFCVLPPLPSWWSLIPDNLRNFLAQLYIAVYYFVRPSNMKNLLQGVFPSPTP